MSTSLTVSSNRIFRRLAEFRLRHGVASIFCKSLDLGLHKIFKTSIYTVVWLDVESVAAVAPTASQFQFRFLTPDEVVAYAKDPAYYLQPGLVDAVREGRELCFAALAGERLAAFGCYTLAFVPPEQASGVPMTFPPNVAYMSYGFTHPDFRGSRLHGLIMGLALKELAATRGISKLVSLVAWTNVASLKSCYRLGYLNVGNMVVVGGQKRAVGLYPKTARRLGVRFGRMAVKAKVD